MKDETLFNVILIISIISIAMLLKYSQITKENAFEQETIISNKLFKGQVQSITKNPNSTIIELNLNSTIKLIIMKNKFYDNISNIDIKKNDELIATGDFSKLYDALNNLYFAKELITKKSSKNKINYSGQ